MVCNNMLNMPGQEKRWGLPDDLRWESGNYDGQIHPTYTKGMDAKQNDEKGEQQPKHEVAETTTNVFDLGLDMSPYIREELKITIQRKRVERGLKEIEVEQNEEVHYDLSEDELEKKQKRRERNKIAAAKLRKKNKLAECSMREEYEKQTELNKRLKYDLERFEREKASILESLNERQSKQLAENKSILSITCLNFQEENRVNHMQLNELFIDSVAPS